MAKIDFAHTAAVTFANKHSLLLSGYWYATKNVPGYINALDKSQGTLRITNGVLCYIERLDGSLFLGHIEWFVPLTNHSIERIDTPTKRPRFNIDEYE